MSLAELTSHADYLADCRHVSSSMLKVARKSPALFHGRYVSRTIPAPEPTRQQTVGSVLHLSLHDLGWRDQLVREPATAPDGKKWYRRKGSDHERWWQEFEASNVGKFALADEELCRVIGMREALLSDPIAGPMLDRVCGIWEQTITWTDAETGIQCKCRPDLQLLRNTIIDIKTAADPSPEGFNRAVENYDYAHQQEWYRAGFMAHHVRDEAPDFLFVVVGSELPHDVLVTRLDMDWQAIGHEENRAALRRLADCYAFDQWHAPSYGTIQTLSPPKWRLKQWEEA